MMTAVLLIVATEMFDGGYHSDRLYGRFAGIRRDHIRDTVVHVKVAEDVDYRSFGNRIRYIRQPVDQLYIRSDRKLYGVYHTKLDTAGRYRRLRDTLYGKVPELSGNPFRKRSRLHGIDGKRSFDNDFSRDTCGLLSVCVAYHDEYHSQRNHVDDSERLYNKRHIGNGVVAGAAHHIYGQSEARKEEYTPLAEQIYEKGLQGRKSVRYSAD